MTIRTVPAREGQMWNLREIVVIAALAVVFGVIYWAWVAAWGAVRVAMGPFGDLSQSIFIGGWMIVAPLSLYIIRKPLTGVISEIVAAFVEFAFLGSPIGPLLLLTGLVQGVGAELPFAATGYRRYGWPVFIASGLSAALFSFVYSAIRFGWLGQANTPAENDLGGAFGGVLTSVILIRLALHLTSGVVLCGVVSKLLGDALRHTGVLDNFAIGREVTSGVTTPAARAGMQLFGGALFVGGIVVFGWAGFAAGDLGVLLQPATPQTAALALVQTISLGIAVIGAVVGGLALLNDGSPSPPAAA